MKSGEKVTATPENQADTWESLQAQTLTNAEGSLEDVPESQSSQDTFDKTQQITDARTKVVEQLRKTNFNTERLEKPYEQELYKLQSQLAEQLVNLREESGVTSPKLISALNHYYQDRFKNNDTSTDYPSQYSKDSLEYLSEIYQDLGGKNQMSDHLLNIDNNQIKDAHEYYQLMKSILLPTGEEASQGQDRPAKTGLLQKLKAKFQRKSAQSPEKTQNKQAEYAAKDFMRAVITYGGPGLVDDDSLAQLTKRFEESQQNHRISGFDVPTDNEIANFLMSEIPLAQVESYYNFQAKNSQKDMNAKVQQRDGYLIRDYLMMHGITQENQQFLEDQVLSEIEQTQDEGTALQKIDMFENALLNFSNNKDGSERLNYIKNELMPRLDGRNTTAVNMMNFAIGSGSNIDELELYKDYAYQTALPLMDSLAGKGYEKYVQRLLEDALRQARKLDNLDDQQAHLSERSQFIAERIVPFLEKTQPSPGESEKYHFLDLAVERGASPELLNHLATEVFPRIDRGEFGKTQREGELLRGEKPILEFQRGCAITKFEPREISEIIYKRNKLNTGDAVKLEQNRIDALAIERVVIDDHTFIHGEEPGTHALLNAMVEYYDARDRADFQAKRAELESTLNMIKQNPKASGFGEPENYVFDLANYDKDIIGEVNDDSYVQQYDEKAIDVVRRLAKNTESISLTPPTTSDAHLNQLMQALEMFKSKENDKVIVDWNEVGDLTKYVNDILIENSGKYGVTPEFVDALVFTERAATYAMRDISERDREELPYDPTFKEIVKFNRLTAAYDKFDTAEFENFWNGFSNVKMGDEVTLRAKYQRLQTRVLTELRKLVQNYTGSDKKDYGFRIQSNNLSHELIGLTEPRAASR